MMQISTEHDRFLYTLLEDKLTHISQMVGYAEEEVSSEKHRVFEAAWEEYLRGLGILRTLEVSPHYTEWSSHRYYVADSFAVTPARRDDMVLLGDPLYTTGKWLEVPQELALKILALGHLP